MEFLPMVVRAEYRGRYKIWLVFNDGVESTVDFSDWLAGPVFEPLKEPGYFERFFLDGGTVAWPNGADIAPETSALARIDPPLLGKSDPPADQRVSAVADL